MIDAFTPTVFRRSENQLLIGNASGNLLRWQTASTTGTPSNASRGGAHVGSRTTGAGARREALTNGRVTMATGELTGQLMLIGQQLMRCLA